MAFPWNGWLRAFKEASPHRVQWVHLETFEVRAFNPRKLGPERAEALQEELHADPGWVEIPWAESDDEYKDMRAFAVSPHAGRAGRDLLMAMASEKPFRDFRAALKKHQGVGKAWADSRWQEAERRLFAFCRAMEIEPDAPRFLELEQELLSDATEE